MLMDTRFPSNSFPDLWSPPAIPGRNFVGVDLDPGLVPSPLASYWGCGQDEPMVIRTV